MSSRNLVLASSLLLFGVFAAIALLVGDLAERRLRSDLDREAARLRTAFEVMQIELEHCVLSITDLLASDTEVRGLFADGAAAVRAEGGGGGREAARIRSALEGRLAPQWERMREEIDLRQIHFHLSPDGTSFLRMNAPGRFGDSLSGFRPLVADVQADGRRRAGFEIGPTFAGIRGAVPVMAPGGDTLVGTLEAGVGFAGHLARLSAHTGVGYGVLLTREAVKDARFGGPSASGRLGPEGELLVATSREELGLWLDRSRLPPYDGGDRTAWLHWDGRIYQLMRFPLRRYSPDREPPVGSVVVWHDIGDRVAALSAFRARVGWLGLLAYLCAQLLALGLVRFGRGEWQRQLDERTRELRRKESLLMELATTDSLTGVFNRRHFFEQLRLQLARLDRLDERCSLMMLDLDHFKRINDGYGHAVGDRVLQRFAGHCRRVLRQTDVIGRIGGEEFAVLLPGQDLESAMTVAERLRTLVAEDRIETDRGSVGVTLSLGVTELDEDDEDPDRVLGRADEALYEAKESGRDRSIAWNADP
ncbi:GGDEF domain-containing protein [Imhoffiella purpurea]|uniref:diguanylate cyclase n=1 Tax=Imhoffiella purpurea TaxID=1249627 RepID=W9V368_9GAMM|nr:diguanylate cyclase [Imhoffiella purpurea]EXJ13938.1 hypothetical protein D779_3138 [Imhoffiella purpurea]